MKKLATKLTPGIKSWIREEFGTDYYESSGESGFFCYPNMYDYSGFKEGYHFGTLGNYTEVSEQEFLAEFGKPKPIIQIIVNEIWKDLTEQDLYRIKPTPDYSKEIEALQNKAKENNQKVIINFEKI